MMVDTELLDRLFRQAADNPRKRMNYDLRTSPEDGSQRMLNALLPGTEVAVHHHPNSDETILAITGRLDVILMDGNNREMERFHLCPAEGRFGCQVPQGVWHTVDVIELSVIFEAKDGKYGEDGSETYSTPSE